MVFKPNVSFGFILRNNETGALQYYYASKIVSKSLKRPFKSPPQLTFSKSVKHC